MSKFPRFPYMADPVSAGCFERSDKSCCICGQAGGWIYAGGIHSTRDDLPRCCPQCIADGSAAREWDGTFVEIDTQADIDPEKVLSVERQTPAFATWQEYFWPVCCRDGCEFIGYAGCAELTGKWADAWPAVLSSCPVDDPDDLLQDLEKNGSPSAYVFRCRHCGNLHGHWDCD